MANNTNKVVGTVFETYDYDQFKVVPENRGQKETKGIKERKLARLQSMIDNETWIHEISRVRVNTNFEVVDGAHTLEICKRNELPVRFEITEHERFNLVTKRDLVGAVYSINSVTTSWTSSELFNAATQCKAPLALALYAIIDNNDNTFLWTDLMALLQKDTRYFMGRWRQASMKTFEDRALLDFLNSGEFELELKAFIKLNLKARIAFKKGIILKAAYDILWHARDMVNPSLFRKSLATIPDNLVQSARTVTDDGARRLLIQHYNKSQGQAVETATVLYALKHKDAQEELLEI